MKRTLDIVPSSIPWRSTIGQCVESLRRYGEAIDAGRHRLGVTASGPDKDMIALRNLATAADTQSACEDLKACHSGGPRRYTAPPLTSHVDTLAFAEDAVALSRVRSTAPSCGRQGRLARR